MKKAMKLVWMVLFALPLVSLTACGDDDEPEPSVEIGDITTAIDVNANSVTFSFPVTANHISDDLVVGYTMDGGITGPATSGSNGVYTFTISDLTLGNTYNVRITAVAGNVRDSETVKVEMPLFMDYSILFGKTRQQTIDFMGSQPLPEVTTQTIQAFAVSKGNVMYIYADYESAYQEVTDYVQQVTSHLESVLTVAQITSYLARNYEVDEPDEDGWYWYYNNTMWVAFVPDTNDVIYIYDPEDDTRAGVVAMKEAAKARYNKMQMAE